MNFLKVRQVRLILCASWVMQGEKLSRELILRPSIVRLGTIAMGVPGFSWSGFREMGFLLCFLVSLRWLGPKKISLVLVGFVLIRHNLSHVDIFWISFLAWTMMCWPPETRMVLSSA